jgi:hypothetical protein
MAFARGKGRAKIDPQAIACGGNAIGSSRETLGAKRMHANVDLKIAFDTGDQPHYGWPM